MVHPLSANSRSRGNDEQGAGILHLDGLFVMMPETRAARQVRAALVCLYLLFELPESGRVHRSVGNRLVQIDVAVPNLDVESAVRIAADPSLVVNGRALTSKVGQRQ